MCDPNAQSPCQSARVRGMRHTAFELFPKLFLATALFMLGLFAIALVHEIVPELCIAGHQADGECPFCKLVYTLALAAVVALVFSVRLPLAASERPPESPCLTSLEFLCNPLRAPPVR